MNKKQEIIKAYTQFLQNEGKTNSTQRSYSQALSLLLDWLAQQNIPYLAVTYNDLLAYLAHLQKRNIKNNTLHTYFGAIRLFYLQAVHNGLIKRSPCEGLEIRSGIQRQPHNLLTREELDALYHNFPTDRAIDQRNQAILGLILFQGLKIGEVQNLKLPQLDLQKGTVYLPERPANNQRTLKLEAQQILQLQAYISQTRKALLLLRNVESQYVFVSTSLKEKAKDNPLQYNADPLIKQLKKLNPKVNNWFQIRASVITAWLERHHIRQVQYMAGHKKVSSTQRYKQKELKTLQQLIDAIKPLNE